MTTITVVREGSTEVIQIITKVRRAITNVIKTITKVRRMITLVRRLLIWVMKLITVFFVISLALNQLPLPPQPHWFSKNKVSFDFITFINYFVTDLVNAQASMRNFSACYFVIVCRPNTDHNVKK